MFAEVKDEVCLALFMSGVERMSPERRRRAVRMAPRWMTGACVVLALAAGGCTPPPPPPLPAMTALSANGDFGYSETALAPDLYTVVYRSPPLAAPGGPDTDYGLGSQKQRVYDLALWRAAQLAIEKGYPAFRVENASRDVKVALQAPLPGPPYLSAPLRTTSGPPCRWDCDRPIGYWGDPYFNPIYDQWYTRSHSSGRVSATLTVKMLSAPVDGALDAAPTAARLQAAYASATFPAGPPD